MCGIVGYIGKNNIKKQLLNSLKLLEYRGYDSSGVAVLQNENMEVIKSEGKIENLEKLLTNSYGFGVGVGHTRWATHGKPTSINAHPHISPNKQWAVVHNGIIENYAELKQNLLTKNEFASQTDTEVIAHLLEQNFSGNSLNTLIKTCETLNGSFALAVANKAESDTLYLAKRKSPLYIAQNGEEIFVASDPICFATKATRYFVLNDNEFCKARVDNIKFYNKIGKAIEKEEVCLTQMEESVGKQNYSHFMLKEIEEVPSVLKRIVKTYTDTNVFKKIPQTIIKNINKVIFVGCGTAYHASLLGASFVEGIAKIDARSYVASEFRYMDPIINSKTLAVFVSQSGETADTLEALNLAKNKGAITVALTNVLYSTIAKSADYVMPVCAGPEIAVASTKAYTAQITILNMFAKFLSNNLNFTSYNYLSEIEYLANHIKMPSINELEKVSNELNLEKMCFFIGRGLDSVTSEEASLKLKEITYINSQSYPAGELKHGFLALVEEGTFVFVIATQKYLLDKTLNAAHEARARGAKLVVATQLELPENCKEDIFEVLPLQNFAEDLMPIASIGAFQLLSYLTSIKRGIDPDKPRNLAKSVTVE